MCMNNDCLKLLKDGIPEMFFVHFDIHRETLESRNILIVSGVLQATINVL